MAKKKPLILRRHHIIMHALRKKPQPQSKKPSQTIAKTNLLLLPLVIALVWLAIIKYSESQAIAGGLSPPNTIPIITGIFIFTFGYFIFLVLMFNEDLREAFKAKRRALRHSIK